MFKTLELSLPILISDLWIYFVDGLVGSMPSSDLDMTFEQLWLLSIILVKYGSVYSYDLILGLLYSSIHTN